MTSCELARHRIVVGQLLKHDNVARADPVQAEDRTHQHVRVNSQRTLSHDSRVIPDQRADNGLNPIVQIADLDVLTTGLIGKRAVHRRVEILQIAV